MFSKRVANGLISDGKVDLQFGREGEKKFRPECKLERFGKRAYFGFAHDDAAFGGAPVWKGKRLETKIGKRLHRMYELANGDIEYEIEYASMPEKLTETLYLDFPEGVRFCLQGELTAAQLARGMERPENIVGSYAVYWKQSGRFLNKAGSEIVNYEAGKMAHIHRPKLIAADGAEVWCEQIINPVTRELTIIMPEEWLKNAAYPVILDPTLGKTNIGATNDTTPGSYEIGSGTFTAASSGTVNSISLYCRASTSGRKVTAGLYSDTGTHPTTYIGKTSEGTSGSGAWLTMNANGVFSLAAGTLYWPAFNSDVGTLNLSVDDDGATATDYVVNTYSAGNQPSPFPTSGRATQANVMSLYVTYTPNVTEMNLNRSPIRGEGRGICRP
jgi:hypothetical protein